jgi:solute carrier family 13 (sodium-dependent dicarboxylate transporter), member 2/3/5
MRKLFAIITGPLAGLLVYYAAFRHGLAAPVCSMAFITVWMAVWWITEAVEIGVTSLLPFVLMPLLHIMKAEDAAVNYMEQTIFLFIGGFFLAYAMEKWDIHHRIAYRIILLTGNSPARILAGTMLTAYVISMWISNTATTLMLVAAVAAIVKHKELFEGQKEGNIGAAFLIGLAYSATIGGMATIVGTPTNMIFTGYWETHYPEREPITFLRWCIFGIPFSLLLLAAGFLILKKLFDIQNVPSGKFFIRDKYAALGRTTREQKTVMLFFAVTVLLWFTRARITIGEFHIGGWEAWFPKGYIKDSTVAICTAICLFVLPSREKGKFILEWKDVKKLPFHIILLFGGGFALAEGIEVSGLGDYLAGQLVFFKDYPPWMLIAALAVLVTILSELASNVATITLMLPILSSLAIAIHIDPVKLMVPATFAASFGFMLVIATAPNTIVYATGNFQSRQLLRAGLWMNLAGITLLTIAMSLFDF